MKLQFNFSLSSVKQAIVTFLHRFHVMVFVFVVLGGVIVVILLLNGIIARSGQSNGYTSQGDSATFDEATIKKIEDLKTRDQNNGHLDLSHGRTNPFVE